jgi:hypothetical protein
MNISRVIPALAVAMTVAAWALTAVSGEPITPRAITASTLAVLPVSEMGGGGSGMGSGGSGMGGGGSAEVGGAGGMGAGPGMDGFNGRGGGGVGGMGDVWRAGGFGAPTGAAQPDSTPVAGGSQGDSYTYQCVTPIGRCSFVAPAWMRASSLRSGAGCACDDGRIGGRVE